MAIKDNKQNRSPFSHHKAYEEAQKDNKKKRHVDFEDRTPAHELGASEAHPPDTHLAPITPVLVLEEVEHVSNVMMAVIAY